MYIYNVRGGPPSLAAPGPRSGGWSQAALAEFDLGKTCVLPKTSGNGSNELSSILGSWFLSSFDAF